MRCRIIFAFIAKEKRQLSLESRIENQKYKSATQRKLNSSNAVGSITVFLSLTHMRLWRGKLQRGWHGKICWYHLLLIETNKLLL